VDNKTQRFIDYLISNKILQPYHTYNMRRFGIDSEIIRYIDKQYKEMEEYALKKCMEYEYGGTYDI